MAIPRPSPHVPDPPESDEPVSDPEGVPDEEDLGPLDDDVAGGIAPREPGI